MAPTSARSLLDRFNPRASVRARLAGAVGAWTTGATVLLVRGVHFLRDQPAVLALVGLAIGLGVLKSRLVLDRAARKAVGRIRGRDRVCFFGFFSPKAWSFVVLMMGAGMALRRSGIHRAVLAVVYVGVGAALLVATRIFWRALFDRPAA